MISTVLSTPEWLLVASLVACTFLLYRRIGRVSISHIPGPEPSSVLLGNMPELLRSAVGDADIRWQQRFGPVYRIKAFFGEDRLFISDPKTIQHIFTSNVDFMRPAATRPLTKLLTGPGVIWAEGDVHKRQRRIMNPSFAVGPLRALVPLFTSVGDHLVSHWKKLIDDSGNKSSRVINVGPWLARATLDVVGNAAFDYRFDSLDNDNNELARAYKGVFFDANSQPSNLFIFVQGLLFRLPGTLSQVFFKYLPTKGRRRMREVRETSERVSKSLVRSKLATHIAGEEGSKDLLTLLVKANASTNEKLRMDDDELLAQMGTLILAGHDTTANSVTWCLYALAQHPDIQSRARAEILSVRQQALERGQVELRFVDFEAMSYLTAVIKEALRYHPVVPQIFRESQKEDVLPLTYPIITKSGQTISELHIGKGQFIHIGINAYNWSKEVWGEDADQFKPERWLDGASERKGAQVGVFANLMTFGAGHKACIGWRFSTLEMQAFLVELLTNFEFSIPAGAKPVRREAAGVVLPVIDDEREKGSQMLLEVKVIA